MTKTTNSAMLALLLLAPLSHAGEWYGVVNLASKHFGESKPMNEVNPGLGIEYATGDVTLMAGAYRNSHSRTSIYGMVGYTPIKVGQFRLGGALGAANGYPGKSGDRTLAIVAGLVQWRYERIGANLLLIPKSKNSDMTIGVQAVWRF